MADEITYYAIVDDHTSPDAPVGVLRQYKTGDRRDESFGHDLEWRFSPIRHAVERGDLQYELIPIGEDEAERIVARIRSLAAPEE
jgi:hypothetical protein